MQSDGCENRVFLGNTGSQIVHLGSREGIYDSESKGNEEANPECYYFFLRWGIELQSHSVPFIWPPYLASKSFGS